MVTDSPPDTDNKSKHTLAILALLTVLPPLFFWLTVYLKFDGGISVLFHFWNYLPDYLFRIIILLLPLPPLVLGVLAMWRIGKHRAKGALISILAILISLFFVIFCGLAVFRPD